MIFFLAKSWFCIRFSIRPDLFRQGPAASQFRFFFGTPNAGQDSESPVANTAVGSRTGKRHAAQTLKKNMTNKFNFSDGNCEMREDSNTNRKFLILYAEKNRFYGLNFLGQTSSSTTRAGSVCSSNWGLKIVEADQCAPWHDIWKLNHIWKFKLSHPLKNQNKTFDISIIGTRISESKNCSTI